MAKRERRVTAGQRLTQLSGQSLEDDQAFWGHDTWVEDVEDNESFHESDEETAVDQFDSDFDETESEGETEVVEAQAEERELEVEEKNLKRKKSTYVDTNNAKRSKKVTGIAKRGKRIVGDGHNAGIVLNMPGSGTSMDGVTPTAPPLFRRKVAPTVTKPSVSPSKIPPIAATRQRRQAKEASGYSSKARRFRGSSSSSIATKSNKVQPARKQQELFTQEQLLMEAVTDTEPANQRWLLGRKRMLAQSEAAAAASASATTSNPVTVQFISRRGALNTVTFGDMERIPTIFTNKGTAPTQPIAPVCAVTGQPARYRDPGSGKPYATIEAFRILREEHRKKCAAAEEEERKKRELEATKKKQPSKKTTVGQPATSKSAAAKNPPAKRKSPTPALSGNAEKKATTAFAGKNNSSSTAKKPPVQESASNGNYASNSSTPPTQDRCDDPKTRRRTTVELSRPPEQTIPTTPSSAQPTAVTDSTNSVKEPNALETAPLAETATISSALESSGGATPHTTLPQLETNGHITTVSHRQKSQSSTLSAPQQAPYPSGEAPLSPGRRSPRKRKPSAKVLESMDGAPRLPS